MRLPLVVTIGLFSSAASAAPTSLTCAWNNGSYIVHHEWILRESEGTADLFVPIMGTARHKLPAVFSSTKVVIVRDDSAAQYTIDRTDMSYTATFQRPLKIFVGKCAFTKAPPRKF